MIIVRIQIIYLIFFFTTFLYQFDQFFYYAIPLTVLFHFQYVIISILK